MNLQLLGFWDYLVIGLYLLFIVGTGLLFNHVNKNVDEYFRGGGSMLWWMAGMSSIAASISAWSFTGASAKVYQSGFLLPLVWFIGMPISCAILWYMAPRFRQMRVITSIEAVARRFGFGTEQFYVYMLLPMALFWGGVGINTIAVIVGAAFNIPTAVAILCLGITVTIMAMLGGQWAVAATDFVQTLLMFLTVAVVVYFSVNLPEIGGVGNLATTLPERHFDFSEFARFELVLFWCLVMQVITVINTLNLNTEGAKYLQVKDAAQARGMVLLRFFLMFILPLSILMQLPAMCAATIFPDMSLLFPDLKIPEEGAFLAMAFHTLPQGMLGLLICGMFAASMSSMDTALNRNAGYFVRNVYIKYLNKEASDHKQLIVGKVFTALFGVIIILIGLFVDQLRDVNLFDLFQILNAVIWLPSLIPAALGIIYKKTPGWSGWSTVVVGLLVAMIASNVYSPELMQSLFGYVEPLNTYENTDGRFIFVSLVVLTSTVGWFFLTSLFYQQASSDDRKRVDALFKDMDTPVVHEQEHSFEQDHMQYQLVGLMALVFGGFILLGALIPNPFWGRCCFVFVGGTLFLIGVVLFGMSRRMRRRVTQAVEVHEG